MNRSITSGVAMGTLLASAAGVTGCQATRSSADQASMVSDVPTASVPAKEALPFPQARTANLWVKGLACPYCVQNVQKQIAGVDGVERVHVDLPTGQVQVELAADHPATEDQLVQAIGDSGFTLDRVEMPK